MTVLVKMLILVALNLSLDWKRNSEVIAKDSLPIALNLHLMSNSMLLWEIRVFKEPRRSIPDVLNNDIDCWQVVLVKSRNRWQYMQVGHQLGLRSLQSTSKISKDCLLSTHTSILANRYKEGELKWRAMITKSKKKWLKEQKKTDIHVRFWACCLFPLNFSDALKELPWYLNMGICDENLKLWDPSTS